MPKNVRPQVARPQVAKNVRPQVAQVARPQVALQVALIHKKRATALSRGLSFIRLYNKCWGIQQIELRKNKKESIFVQNPL